MAQWIIDWLATASLVELSVAFLVENLLILAGVVAGGWPEHGENVITLS